MDPRYELEPCPECKGTGEVTLYDVDLGGGFRGDADEQECALCDGTGTIEIELEEVE